MSSYAERRARRQVDPVYAALRRELENRSAQLSPNDLFVQQTTGEPRLQEVLRRATLSQALDIMEQRHPSLPERLSCIRRLVDDSGVRALVQRVDEVSRRLGVPCAQQSTPSSLNVEPSMSTQPAASWRSPGPSGEPPTSGWSVAPGRPAASAAGPAQRYRSVVRFLANRLTRSHVRELAWELTIPVGIMEDMERSTSSVAELTRNMLSLYLDDSTLHRNDPMHGLVSALQECGSNMTADTLSGIISRENLL